VSPFIFRPLPGLNYQRQYSLFLSTKTVMSLFVVLLRVALSGIFGVAGVTKLLDLKGTREAVKNFGAPEWLVSAISIVLPLVELAIALGLLFVSTTIVSSLGAILLLALFVIAIGVSLAQGRTPDCHCFGQLYSRPLGWPTLARNAVFALAAGFVFWLATSQGTAEIIATLSGLSSSQWLWLLVGVAAVAALLVFLNRRQTKAQAVANQPQKGLPLDAVAPEFEVAAYRGGTISLAELVAERKPVLLIFTSPKCGPCIVLLEEIKKWQESHQEQLTIALLSMGTIKENFVNVARNGLGEVLLQEKREVAEMYGAILTPTAVVVTPDGKIGSPLAAGADNIRTLLSTVLGNSNNNNHSNHKH
jgi:peroxiredoxin